MKTIAQLIDEFKQVIDELKQVISRQRVYLYTGSSQGEEPATDNETNGLDVENGGEGGIRTHDLICNMLLSFMFSHTFLYHHRTVNSKKQLNSKQLTGMQS